MAKRIIIIITMLLFSILLSTFLSSYAVEDLSTYTNEELLWLSDAIDEELKDRDTDGIIFLSEGMYIVGKDVQAGAYRSIAYNNDIANKAFVSLNLYDSIDKLSETPHQIGIISDKHTRVILVDGICIDVQVLRGNGLMLVPD